MCVHHIGHDVCMANVCVTLVTMWAWLMSVSHWSRCVHDCVTCWSLGRDRLHGHDVCRILRVRGGEQTQPERRADCCPWTRTQVSPSLPLLQTSALLSPFVCDVYFWSFFLFFFSFLFYSSLHSERCYLPLFVDFVVDFFNFKCQPKSWALPPPVGIKLINRN